MTKSNPDILFDRLSEADYLPDNMLAEAFILLEQAFTLGYSLGTRGELLSSWASFHLLEAGDLLRQRGLEIPGENHAGLRTHRLASNPEEQVFADQWAKMNEDPSNILDHLLVDDPNSHYVKSSSAHDRTVAATVIQWLGSPVGQGFLRDCGYIKITEEKEK